MEKVTGLGGFFFVAEHPEELAQWYQDMLGIAIPPTEADGEVFTTTAGPLVFSPSSGDDKMEDLLGPRGWGLNLRVANLDAMVAQLVSAGVDVRVDPTEYPFGRFAFLKDPEGNQLQLWENRG